MRKILSAVVAMALLSGDAVAQKPADVHGWGKVKWGMTLGQIQKLYPEAEPFTRGENSGLEIPRLDLVDEPFTVTFALQGAGDKVAHVELSTRSRGSTFTELEKQLKLKYGEPTLKTDETNGFLSERGLEVWNRSRTWMFPSTEIRLYLMEHFERRENRLVRVYGHDLVGIVYQPVDKRTREKL